MSIPLRVLILEDRAEDAELVVFELRRAGFEPDWQRVETEESSLASLDPALDLILADYALPQFDALRGLRLMQARGLEIPFIIVSGTIGEDAAVSAIQQGAIDYLLKDRLARLGSAVARALEQKRLRDEKRQADAALRASEKRFRALIEHSSDAVSLLDERGTIRYASPATTRILGYEIDEFVGRDGFELIHRDDPSQDADRFSQFLQHPALSVTSQLRVRHKDGSWRWLEAASTNLLDEPSVQGIVVNYRDITERKQYEEKLRLSDEILQRIGTLVLVADAQAQITYISPSVRTILGYEPADLLGDRWWELGRDDPIEREREKKYVARCATGEIPLIEEPYERLVRHQNGELRWILWQDSKGPGSLIIGVGHDITERKQHERELEAMVTAASVLRAAPSRYHMLPAIVNEVPNLLKADGVALLMPNSTKSAMAVALARGAWAEWTGLHFALGEDVIGHILSRAGARPYLNNAIDSDPHLARPELINGMRAVACVPLIAENQTIAVLAVGRKTDISENELRLLAAIGDMSANALHRAQIVETLERRVAERTAELEHQRQRMQAILDTAGDGIVITDLDGQIEYVNPAHEQMSGFAAAEVIGQTPRVWASDQTPGAVYDDLARTLARGNTWRGELVDRRKDGSLYDVALTITPLKDVQGNITGSVGIHHNISQLKELDRLKSKFVSDVSHELRTPITNLKLYADLLEHGKPDKRPQYLETLKEQANRLAQLVEDILNLSRLELGADKVQFAPVDLNALARQVVDAHRPTAEAAGLTLAFTPDPELPPVWGEPNQLAQVITNLVANGINYTSAGQVGVSTQLRNGQACLEVRDTGRGIYPEDLPHLFERFYRGRHAGQPGVPGTGLGLAIVKEIVDLHYGQISVASQVGVGTTFTVRLPLPPSTEGENK